MKILLLLTTERKYDSTVITHQGTKVQPIAGRSRSVGMSWKTVTDRQRIRSQYKSKYSKKIINVKLD
jgi:hypothetical protein